MGILGRLIFSQHHKSPGPIFRKPCHDEALAMGSNFHVRMAAAGDSQPDMPGQELLAGTLVRISGLTSAAGQAWNGRVGIVVKLGVRSVRMGYRIPGCDGMVCVWGCQILLSSWATIAAPMCQGVWGAK